MLINTIIGHSLKQTLKNAGESSRLHSAIPYQLNHEDWRGFGVFPPDVGAWVRRNHRD